MIPTVMIYWNELSPYRLHLMCRLASEVPETKVMHVFSHSLTRNSMPWRMEVPSYLNVFFEPTLAIPRGRFLHPNAWCIFRKVAKLMDQLGPQMLILHGHNDLSRWLVAMAARVRRIPVIHASDANLFDDTVSPRFGSIVTHLYRRAALSLADGYMPMGLGGRLYYGKYGSATKPMFYFPYEPDAYLGESETASFGPFSLESGRASPRRYFLYSGRLVEVKRVDLVIRAFASVAADRPEWDLVIAGTGPLEGQLRSLVPQSIAHRVHFVGFLQRDNLAACYQSCDVLVHASMREPWGLVIHEAVAGGMAVVATDTAGASVELVRHRVNGLLCPPGSLAHLTHAMRAVSDAGTLARFKARSADVLRDWRCGYDPVDGFRDAVTHFCRVGSAMRNDKWG